MDVITIGESMVLFTPQSPGPLRFANTFEKKLGGAESNMAIALSRLGHQTGWISRLGDDEFGLYVRNIIRGEGVDTSRVIFDKSSQTAVFFKGMNPGGDPNIYYYRRKSAASNLSPDDIDEDYVAKAKYIHLTGITPALSLTCRNTIYHVLHVAKKNRQTVVFDPNIRLKLWSKQEAGHVLQDIAKQSDIVLSGIDEGQLLTGKDTPEDIANNLLQGKAHTVVIKLGDKGALLAKEGYQQYVPGMKVNHVVDTAGAGDGFAAGFLSGCLRGYDDIQSVELANQIGAHALSVSGDVEGYPYWSQLTSNGENILR
ncbi:2-dehydro-3-deoxygluconokinase [Salinibacillus kushneri]|uniref:2-dehydro-3-deoxygluconokinase n=1 Tax=Salinibacillus kushneri TaxID=237682 RepID=A0A1I0C9J7_9BACI|nr:sugar kinase [Salinibacillus kushneri]SET16136.1 2-dehydro-3-deoxygluconokinase [Salinibacillus kushneri]